MKNHHHDYHDDRRSRGVRVMVSVGQCLSSLLRAGDCYLFFQMWR